jgi:hypothetical protein
VFVLTSLFVLTPAGLVLAPGAHAGVATKLVITTGVSSMTAGDVVQLTITAEDNSGAVDTTYAGDRTLTFSGASPSTNPVLDPTVMDKNGTPQNFGDPTTITFTNGVAATGVSMALYAAGTDTVTVGDGTLSTSSGNGGGALSMTVNAGLASNLEIDGSTSEFAGQSQQLTLSAVDGYGNADPTYSGDKTVTFFGYDSTNFCSSPSDCVTQNGTAAPASFGGVTPSVTDKTGTAQPFDSPTGSTATIPFTNGVASAGGLLTLTAAQTFTLEATDGSLNAGTLTVDVNGTRLVITGSASQTAGASQQLTITAKNQSNATDTTYTGDHTLVFSGANSSASPATAPTVTNKNGTAVAFGSNTTITFTNGVASAGGSMKLYKAEDATIAVSESGGPASSGSDDLAVTVSPGALGQFALSLASPQTSGVAFTGTNTLTAQDAYGNADTAFNVSTDPVVISANSPLAGPISGLQGPGTTLNQAADFTNGVANLTNLELTYTGVAGTGTFTATSQASNKTGTSGAVAVTAGATLTTVTRYGPAKTAAQVTITGTNLGTTATTAVTYGTGGTGSTCTGVAVTAGTSLTCTTGTDITAGSSVRFIVSVNSVPSTASTATYTGVAVPAVSSVTPFGLASAATQVTITGTDLGTTATTTVTYGTGGTCTGVAVTAGTSLTCTTGTDITAGSSVRFIVTVNSVPSPASTATYTGVLAPMITSITPSSAPAGVTQTVTISGNNFGSAATALNSVTYGTGGTGSNCTNASWISPTQIYCVVGTDVPSGTSVAFIITINGLGSAASATNFTALVPTCAAGTYLSGSSCVAASAGYFVAASGATAQEPCPVGAYQPSTGQGGCMAAGADFYVDQPGQGAETACPAGTSTNDKTGQSACATIPVVSVVNPSSGQLAQTETVTVSGNGFGTSAPTSLAISAQSGQQTSQCTSPQYISATTATCVFTSPAIGIWSFLVAVAGQTSQPGGTFTVNCSLPDGIVGGAGAALKSAGGDAVCEPCPTGTKAGVDGFCDISTGYTCSGVPSVCTFKVTSGSVITCVPGQFASKSKCVLADPGSYVATAGQTTETPCAANSFSNVSGSKSCTPCPAKKTTNGQTGSTNCVTAAAILSVSSKAILGLSSGGLCGGDGTLKLIDCPAAGIPTLTVTGSNFVSTDTIGGVDGTTTFGGANTLTTTIGPQAGSNTVTLTISGSTSSATLSFRSGTTTSGTPPTIASISSGSTCTGDGSLALLACPAAGIATLTVNGSHFVRGDKITGVSGATTYSNATTLTTSIAAQTGSNVLTLAVSGPNGNSAASATVTFKQPAATPVITSVDSSTCVGKTESGTTTVGVTSCPSLGSSVLINGRNFFYTTTVTPGLCANLYYVSFFQLLCLLRPAVPGTVVNVQASTPGMGKSAPTGFTVTYLNVPTISSLSDPACTGTQTGFALNGCPSVGGSTLQISGANFLPSSTLTTGLCSNVVWVNTNTILCTLSSGIAPGTSVNVVVTTLAGSSLASGISLSF